MPKPGWEWPTARRACRDVRSLRWELPCSLLALCAGCGGLDRLDRRWSAGSTLLRWSAGCVRCGGRQARPCRSRAGSGPPLVELVETSAACAGSCLARCWLSARAAVVSTGSTGGGRPGAFVAVVDRLDRAEAGLGVAHRSSSLSRRPQPALGVALLVVGSLRGLRWSRQARPAVVGRVRSLRWSRQARPTVVRSQPWPWCPALALLLGTYPRLVCRQGPPDFESGLAT